MYYCFMEIGVLYSLFWEEKKGSANWNSDSVRKLIDKFIKE
jgi:cbb3-type cytochrome oxidase subunit 3